MPRLLFEKKGNAVWISHLDLMRLFQRAFKRAGLPLTHTHGFNPRPSVSIAMPLSVGVHSSCELLDFDLDGCEATGEQILAGLNAALVDGVRVLQVYDDGRKLKHLAFLDCTVRLEFDAGIPDGAEDAVVALFSRESLTVEKRSQNGTTEQDIIPMIRRLSVSREDGYTLRIDALICCQNPTLNPMQLASAVSRYLPELAPDHVWCCRNEIYDTEDQVFR